MHSVRHMGYQADLRKNSRCPQTSRTVAEKISSTQAAQIVRVQDQLKLEKPISKSYGDLHHEIKQTLGDGPLFPRKSPRNCQKQSVEGKSKDDELVKHMSNLPRYLQRVEGGENPQEKVLNFGVLDWGRLEKWKYNQNAVPQRSVMYSPSTSSTSSPFSTIGSSTLSTGSDSGILANRKRSPSRSAHVTSSPKESRSMGVKPTTPNIGALQDTISASTNSSVGRQKLSGTDLSSRRSHSKMKFEKGMKNDINSKFIMEKGIPSSNLNSSELSFSSKGKNKVQDGGSTQRTERFQECTTLGQHSPGRDKTIVLLLPKNIPQKRFLGSSPNAKYTMSEDCYQTEARRSSFSDGFCVNEEVQFSELYSEIPHSCPQLFTAEANKQSEMNLPCSIDASGLKAPSDVLSCLQQLREMDTVRSEHMQAEKNMSRTKPTDSKLLESFKGSGLKPAEPPSARCGNQSPNRWLSVGQGKISRSLSFKESSALPQLSSSYLIAKSGPVELDAFSNSSSRDKSTCKSRTRSSPLRRLLDPLLKPKTANRHTSAEPLQDEAHIIGESPDRPLASSAKQMKISTTSSGSRPTDTDGAHQQDKNVVSMVQALLQVTVKNGLPWFTFAVDNNSDILAATMRKTNSSEKYDCSWIYTFYSFRKGKKKSGGWMSHGSKAKSLDYVPNLVGQMKVNGSQCTKSARSDSENQLMVREFVLFEVEPRKADQETSSFQTNVELAAIVIKVPKETAASLNSDRQQIDNREDLLGMRLREKSLDKSLSSIEYVMNGPFFGSQSLSSILAVLPSGVHGLSPTGLPSPLLDRWRSGGSCDCGGWDLGCQLRVLSNHDQCAKKLDSTTLSCGQEKFDLFVQRGGSQESIPSLCFSTYNKGVHSIDFNSSMSSVQAFSICIAFLHCKNLAKVSNLFEEITAQEPISLKTERMKLSTEEKAPSSCAQFPPPSPVGRV